MAKKSYLSWTGGKLNAMDELYNIFNTFEFDCLVEPFFGAGSVSLNFPAKEYIWNDYNADVINLHKIVLSSDISEFLSHANKLFSKGASIYLDVREQFNKRIDSDVVQAARFLYMNKHGFNGLVRYNSKGRYNVPVGTDNKRNIIASALGPMQEFRRSLKNSKHSFMIGDYKKVFDVVEKEQTNKTMIYCDPPYSPIRGEDTLSYTDEGFSHDDHIELMTLCKESKHLALISNHWTDQTRQLYSDADEIHTFDVRRTVSCDGKNRNSVTEVVAVYYPTKKEKQNV